MVIVASVPPGVWDAIIVNRPRISDPWLLTSDLSSFTLLA